MCSWWCLHTSAHLAFYFVLERIICTCRHLGINFSMFSCILHTSVRHGILLCVKMGRINRFIVDCRMYLFWFHIINQSGNALLASQSEEVTTSSQFQVDIPHSTVATDWSVSTDYKSANLTIRPWRDHGSDRNASGTLMTDLLLSFCIYRHI